MSLQHRHFSFVFFLPLATLHRAYVHSWGVLLLVVNEFNGEFSGTIDTNRIDDIESTV